MPERTFTTDIAAIRASTRQNMKEGTVAGSDGMLRDDLADLLGS
jgi:hypothetical protein